MEFDFGSKWAFPYKEMERLTNELKEDRTLFIRCLSYEFGCDYVDLLRYFEKDLHNKNTFVPTI